MGLKRKLCGMQRGQMWGTEEGLGAEKGVGACVGGHLVSPMLLTKCCPRSCDNKIIMSFSFFVMQAYDKNPSNSFKAKSI